MEEVKNNILTLKTNELDESLLADLDVEKNKDNLKNVNHKISVCVRKRPLNGIEDMSFVNSNNITIQNDKVAYDMQDYKTYHSFKFDEIVNMEQNNFEIFDKNIKEYVDHALCGGSSTIIAYGQTGTGKTHTMLEDQTGLIYQSIKYAINHGNCGNLSFYEIYLGRISDCFNNSRTVSLLERDGVVYSSEMFQIPFKSFEEAKKIIADGLSRRKSGKVGDNLNSSRSHAIILLDFKNSLDNPCIKNLKKLHSDSCMIFLDLAGSERGADRTFDNKKLYSEGSEINKSLLALKECIRGVKYKSEYLPFRHSKLTQILKNALTGNSKTLLIATIATNRSNLNHTLNTLRYATRVKEESMLRPSEVITKSFGKSKTITSLTNNISGDLNAYKKLNETNYLAKKSYIEFPVSDDLQNETFYDKKGFKNYEKELVENKTDLVSKTYKNLKNVSDLKNEIFYILPDVVEGIGVENDLVKLRKIFKKVEEMRFILKKH